MRDPRPVLPMTKNKLGFGIERRRRAATAVVLTALTSNSAIFAQVIGIAFVERVVEQFCLDDDIMRFPEWRASPARLGELDQISDGISRRS